jgi:uncharacterized SAM-binding protein YcdF (DUF218 family)
MFVISKLFNYFFLPPGIFIVLLFLAAFLVKRFKTLFFISALIFWFISTRLGANLLIMPLENIQSCGNFKPSAVVILGGGVNKDSFYKAFSDAFKREIYAINIAKEKNLPIVFCGGGMEGLSEAKAFLSDLNKTYPKFNNKIYLEEKSLNTEQNAKNCAKLFKDNNLTKNIFLVTSAYHIKRAKLYFEKEGFKTILKPIGFSMQKVSKIYDFLPNINSLEVSVKALHEYVGLLYFILKN